MENKGKLILKEYDKLSALFCMTWRQEHANAEGTTTIVLFNCALSRIYLLPERNYTDLIRGKVETLGKWSIWNGNADVEIHHLMLSLKLQRNYGNYNWSARCESVLQTVTTPSRVGILPLNQ